MKITKFLTLNKLLKEKNIDSKQMLEFIEKLQNKESLEQAQLFIEALNATGVAPKYVKPQDQMSEEELQTIRAELKSDLFNRIHTEFFSLLNTKIYNSPITKNKKGSDRIYNRAKKIKNLSPLLRHIAHNYSENYRYSNPKIHASISIGFDFSPDTKIQNIHIEAQKITIKNTGLESDYVNDKDGHSTFKELVSFSWDQPAVFYKDLSLLQLFCRFGLDDLIELSVVYGADIHYKEPTQNLTALDLYNTFKSALNPANMTAYTTALLDGTYNNGQYQILYDKKRLEKNIEKNSDDNLGITTDKKSFKL